MRTRTRVAAFALLLIGALYASCAQSPADDPQPSSAWDSLVWDQGNWQ